MFGHIWILLSFPKYQMLRTKTEGYNPHCFQFVSFQTRRAGCCRMHGSELNGP